MRKAAIAWKSDFPPEATLWGINSITPHYITGAPNKMSSEALLFCFSSIVRVLTGVLVS